MDAYQLSLFSEVENFNQLSEQSKVPVPETSKESLIFQEKKEHSQKSNSQCVKAESRQQINSQQLGSQPKVELQKIIPTEKRFPGFREVSAFKPGIQVLKEKAAPEMPDSAYELLSLYKQELQEQNQESRIPVFQSSVRKYVAPGWDESLLSQDKRLSNQEISNIDDFLTKLPAKKFLSEAKSMQEKVFQSIGLDKDIQRRNRSLLKQMLEWAMDKGWEINEDRTVFYQFKEVSKSRNHVYDMVHTDRKICETYILGAFDSDYISVYTPPFCFKDLVKQSKDNFRWIALSRFSPYLYLFLCFSYILYFEPNRYLANQEFDNDLNKFLIHLEHNRNLRISTREKTIGDLLRYLGWLHRTKEIPLEKLSLTLVIPFIKLNTLYLDYLQNTSEVNESSFFIQKERAREQCKQIGKNIVKTLEEYRRWSNNDPRSTIEVVKMLVNLAKYIYWDETEEQQIERGGFTDIPIIEILRKASKDIENKASDNPEVVIPREEKMLPWLKILEIVEKLRIEAEISTRVHVRHTRLNRNGSNYIEIIKRKDSTIAASVQRFLIVALMTASPPDRPRTYYELEIGRTFKKGYYDGTFFTPAEKVKDPSKIFWWIHLMPLDYKTGRSYGESWCRIPNTCLSNGKRLYDYVEEWITRWRPLFNPNHNNLFTKQNGKPITGPGFGSKVKHSLCRFSEVPVTPNTFRHSFVTYLKELKTSPADMESIAAAMHHSVETQSKIYNQQDKQEKIEMGLELIQKVNESAFKEIKEKGLDISEL